MATEAKAKEPGAKKPAGLGAPVFVLIAAIVLGTALFWYIQYSSSRKAQGLELSREAKQYISQQVRLSEVEMKAAESYLKQRVVEITGKVSNNGDRGLDTVEIYCVFYDAYGQVVLRQRVAIISERSGGLKPGETRSFRLPFDDLPESWNHQMPQLVMAGVKFSS